MSLSDGAKERLGVVFEVVKTVFHWGFIPTVLYLGKIKIIIHFTIYSMYFLIIGFQKGSEQGMAPLSVASLLWQ